MINEIESEKDEKFSHYVNMKTQEKTVEEKEESREEKREEKEKKIDTDSRFTSKTIITLLEKKESLTVQELCDFLPTKSEQSIRSSLFFLKKKKIIDCSTTRPKSYFLREMGDPALKSALSALTEKKMSYMA